MAIDKSNIYVKLLILLYSACFCLTEISSHWTRLSKMLVEHYIRALWVHCAMANYPRLEYKNTLKPQSTVSRAETTPSCTCWKLQPLNQIGNLCFHLHTVKYGLCIDVVIFVLLYVETARRLACALVGQVRCHISQLRGLFAAERESQRMVSCHAIHCVSYPLQDNRDQDLCGPQLRSVPL